LVLIEMGPVVVLVAVAVGTPPAASVAVVIVVLIVIVTVAALPASYMRGIQLQLQHDLDFHLQLLAAMVTVVLRSLRWIGISVDSDLDWTEAPAAGYLPVTVTATVSVSAVVDAVVRRAGL
jgi:hypothetical protein